MPIYLFFSQCQFKKINDFQMYKFHCIYYLYSTEENNIHWVHINDCRLLYHYVVYLYRISLKIDIYIFITNINTWIFLKTLFIYSWERERRESQRHRQREKQAPSWEPDVGLNPGSPGSCPGPKAVLNRWATQAVLSPNIFFFSPNILKRIFKIYRSSAWLF